MLLPLGQREEETHVLKLLRIEWSLFDIIG